MYGRIVSKAGGLASRSRVSGQHRLRHGLTRCHAEPLESRELFAGTPELVRDINTTTDMLGTDDMVTVGSVAFFTGHASATDGAELFKTDATTAGTVLVKDIVPGVASSEPSGLTGAGGTLFFAATDAAGDRELWRSDGTDAGTYRVKDLNPAGDANPANLTASGSLLFFTADDGTGTKLFRSDGTDAGTVAVAAVSSPAGLTAFNGGLLYTNNSSSRSLMYVNAAGTVSTVSSSLDARAPFALGGSAYFFAGPGTSGTTPGNLYRTDGTAAGTVPVKAIDYLTSGTDYGSVSTSVLAVPVVSGNLLYFRAGNRLNGTYDLWRTDGTAAGTFTLLANLSTTTPVSPVGTNGVVFANTTPATGYEPWVSDGTVAGTKLLKELAPGTASGVDGLGGLRSGAFTYFASNRAVGDGSLYRTDGTAAGTTLVTDVQDTPGYVFLNGVANGKVMFTATRFIGTGELYRTDGTAAGTVRVGATTPGNANAGSMSDFTPVQYGGQAFAAAGDRVYFSASDGTTGQELWRTDGAAGAIRVADLAPGGDASDPASFTAADDGALYFTAATPSAGREVWRLAPGSDVPQMLPEVVVGNGTPSPANLTAVGNLLYYTVSGIPYRFDPATNARTEVRAAGNVQLTSAGALARAGSAWYFRATTGTTGAELWRVDASATAVPQLVKDVYAGSTSSNADPIGAIGSSLLFAARQGTADGTELWITDGTSGGTTRVGDLNLGTGSTSFDTRAIVGAAAAGNVLYFSADAAGGSNYVAWRSDGTAAGTYKLDAGRYQNPWQFKSAGTRAVFVAWDGSTADANDRNVYRTGDAANPDAVAALTDSASTGFNAGAVHVNGDQVFAIGYPGVNLQAGMELWRSTLSPGTAERVARLAPYVQGGPHSPAFSALYTVGTAAMASTSTHVYFPMLHPTGGLEPHRLAIEPPAPPPAIAGAFVAGTGWSGGFMNYLQAAGQGDAAFGFAVDPAATPDELPWTNLNQVSVRFSRGVNVTQNSLTVTGVNVAGYAVAGFGYDAATFTATWTLAATVGPEKLSLNLAGVTDAVTRSALVGSTLVRLNVLPGDVNRSGSTVNAGDVTQVRNRQFTDTGNPGAAPNTYTAFHDVNGNGFINAQDVTLTRNRQFTELPVGEPPSPLRSLRFGPVSAAELLDGLVRTAGKAK